MSLGETMRLRGTAPGFRPGGRVTFFCGARKSNQKRGPEHQPFGDHASDRGELQELWHENPNRGPEGSRRSETAGLNLSEVTEDVVRFVFSSQSR